MLSLHTFHVFGLCIHSIIGFVYTVHCCILSSVTCIIYHYLVWHVQFMYNLCFECYLSLCACDTNYTCFERLLPRLSQFGRRTLDCSSYPQNVCIGWTNLQCIPQQVLLQPRTLPVSSIPLHTSRCTGGLTHFGQTKEHLSPNWWSSTSTWCLSLYGSVSWTESPLLHSCSD